MDQILDRVLGCLPRPPAPTTTGPHDAAIESSSSPTFSSPSCSPFSSSGRRVHISALPDDLLRKIVSKLPVKEAARTTVLSSSWGHIWASTPLVLYDNDLLPANGAARSRDVVAAVSRVIDAHPGPFHSVHLTSPAMKPGLFDLKDWIRDCATKGVTDLIFVNRRWPIFMKLPDEILQCTSLERLYVAFCYLPYASNLPAGDVLFPNLRELGICIAGINKEDFDRMLAGSPKLEKLAFIGHRVLLRGIDLSAGGSLQCVLFWYSVPYKELTVDGPCLDRLILWEDNPFCYNDPSIIKIGCATRLRAVGYLNPRLHVLQIGDTVGTKASPDVVVPSVKSLAINFRFGINEEERMALLFLTCFPGIQTLHIKSDLPPFQPSVDFDRKLWKKSVGSIECVKTDIQKLVFYDFRGDNSELSFIRHILKNANVLKEMYILLSNDILPSVEYETTAKLTSTLAAVEWASTAAVKIFRPRKDKGWNYKTASDLSRSDPFDYLS